MKRKRKISKYPEPEFLPPPVVTNGNEIWKKEYVRHVFFFSLLGATDLQIAQVFGVSPKTIELWKRTKPEFMHSMKQGKMIADGQVVHSLYLAAIGYSHNDEVIIPNKVKIYGENGKVKKEYTKIIRVKTVKNYPPNVTAAVKWLQARQPDVWGKKLKLEGTVEHNHKLDLSGFTEQELEVLKKLNRKSTGEIEDIGYEDV